MFPASQVGKGLVLDFMWFKNIYNLMTFLVYLSLWLQIYMYVSSLLWNKKISYDLSQCSQSETQFFETLQLFQIPPCKTLLFQEEALCGQHWGLCLWVTVVLICQCKYDHSSWAPKLVSFRRGEKPQLPPPILRPVGRGMEPPCLTGCGPLLDHCPHDGTVTLGTVSHWGTGLVQYNPCGDVVLASK